MLRHNLFISRQLHLEVGPQNFDEKPWVEMLNILLIAHPPPSPPPPPPHPTPDLKDGGPIFTLGFCLSTKLFGNS